MTSYSLLTRARCSYVFHYTVKDGVTFMCFATKEHKTSVCFAFLDEISKRFKATYEQSQIDNAVAYSPQFEEFARVVEQEMNRFGRMKFADNKIAEVNEKVDATKMVMQDNVRKVMDVSWSCIHRARTRAPNTVSV